MQGRLIRLAQFNRPFPPWLAEAPAQHFEHCERLQHWFTRALEVVELASSCFGRERAKSIECKAKRLRLALRNARIVNQIALPQRRDRGLKFCQRGAWTFRDGFDVDIERVEKHPAAWKIGARFLGPVIEQRMQRIESNPRS